LFGPDSMMWRISRESVMLFGGRAAVLMQLAHPLVAAGVAAHSDYRSDPYKRLRRTLDTMYTIVFESAEDARDAVARVNDVHDHVKGVAGDGRKYSALDPHLQLWVHTTLVYSSIKVYERFIEPLTPDELERYYQESKVIGSLFGIPGELHPETYEELVSWMWHLMDTGEVQVTDLARELADPIVRPLSLVPRGLSRGTSLITPGLLPRPIREGYGFTVGASRAAVMAIGGRAARLVLPRLPQSVRTHPAARNAERRTA